MFYDNNKQAFKSKDNRPLVKRSGEGPQVNKFDSLGAGVRDTGLKHGAGHAIYHIGTPLPCERTGRQTRVKTLHSRIRMQTVINIEAAVAGC